MASSQDLPAVEECCVEKPIDGKVTTILRTRVDRCIEKVEAFTHFYTNQIALMYKDAMGNNMSALELHVLHQVSLNNVLTVPQIIEVVPSLDEASVDSILSKLSDMSLVSVTEEKPKRVCVTAEGKEKCSLLKLGCRNGASKLLNKLSRAEQNCLVESMLTVERILTGTKPSNSSYMIRQTHQPGDIGWIVHRHGVLYFQEYDWDERFEALCAEIGAKFIENYDPKYDRCWLAERDGEIVGCVILVKADDKRTVAKLRLLLVEPSARGLGIGARLVDECVKFARDVAGYEKIVLWTQSILRSAIQIYSAAGFVMVKEEEHNSFGHQLVAQTWELNLKKS